jgi:hypothetical protein
LLLLLLGQYLPEHVNHPSTGDTHLQLTAVSLPSPLLLLLLLLLPGHRFPEHVNHPSTGDTHLQLTYVFPSLVLLLLLLVPPGHRFPEPLPPRLGPLPRFRHGRRPAHRNTGLPSNPQVQSPRKALLRSELLDPHCE